MGKPRMIILIRHAQSEGNKNREIHQTIPDHRVQLTPEGHRQALEAGSKLRTLLRPDDKIHFFTSPYRRARETTEGILQTLTSDLPSPSPFPRHTIKVYEEPRLREQDFGNFQPCSAEMERMWLERADYGHFFYRISNGESAADAYDRVSGFNESLWRQFGENDFASVCVLVTHGLMTRVFLMKWYHWSVEYFEDLRNINHCEFVIMKLNPDNGKYVLQNQLRTWSELRREKELERARERAAKGLDSAPPTPSDRPISIKRKWGGCPDGCNHGIQIKEPGRSSRVIGTDDMWHHLDVCLHHKAQDKGDKGSTPSGTTSPTSPLAKQHIITAPEPALGDLPINVSPIETAISPPDGSPHHHFFDPRSSRSNHPTDDETKANKRSTDSRNFERHPRPPTSSGPSLIPKRPGLANFHRDSDDHLLHSPSSNYTLLHHLGGRDGGGSLSGFNSLAPSEDEHEEPPKSNKLPHLRQLKPSQEPEDDGDDEGSGNQVEGSRRMRVHHHHIHPNAPERRPLVSKGADPLGDQKNVDDDSTENSSQLEIPQGQLDDGSKGEPREDDDDDDDDNGLAALEAERQRDQSIRGSVY